MVVRKIGDAPERLKVTCNKCFSVLEYVPLDIQESNHTDISGTTDTYYWIVCCECKNKVTVKSRT